MRLNQVYLVFAIITSVSLFPSEKIIGQNLLWSLGKPDGNNSEFRFSPNQYKLLKTGGFFIIGQSDEKTDWPYVHPGPGDHWAGEKTNTFSIIFAIRSIDAASGKSQLEIDLLDTHQGNPGTIEVQINKHSYTQKLPDGSGDETINGRITKAKPHKVSIEFPTGDLNPGNNIINIINATGSWFLYDAVSLKVPESVKAAKVKDFIEISSYYLEPGILKESGQLLQNLSLKVMYAGPSKKVSLVINEKDYGLQKLEPGMQEIKITIPEVMRSESFDCQIKDKSRLLANLNGQLNPSGHKTIYILPHSHTDIGYTDYQTAIEDKQIDNLVKGIQYAMETADYPEGARFIWNVEVAWAADLYLNRLNDQDKDLFYNALQKGWISLNGMYLNELTGLCRPEELLRLFRFSTQLSTKTGATVDAAMISDVPGYTWGTVSAMAQAGIKYFSVAPNYFDRIGDILQQWENKPFYWVGPSGKEKVLVWIPFKGYAWSHTITELNQKNAEDFLKQLYEMDYPYSISYMRWSGHGDNAVPEKQICDFVRDWNAKYEWPRFVISSTSEAFRAFEAKHGDEIPEYSGDWTPYWEDGAGSSALETGINRNTADRLTQAAALFAMSPSVEYPANLFDKAWEKTLLYSEHTWGAWCSITDPENDMTTGQWAIKKGYADAAARMSWELLNMNILSPDLNQDIYVTNTLAWERSDKITLQKDVSQGIKAIVNDKQQIVPSQRLSSGELVFIPEPVPAFSSSHYQLLINTDKRFQQTFPDIAKGNNILDNGLIRIEIDTETGSVKSIKAAGQVNDFVDGDSDHKMNQFLFFEGADVGKLETNSKPVFRVIENGPVTGVIEARSEAPGCESLIQLYKLSAGQDYLEIENIVDKTRAPMPERIGDWFLAQNKNKESVNFAFPANVPDGIMRLDLPIGSMIPWIDQIPSACKNWFTVGRYADVSNDQIGLSWFTLDAPLIEVGEISANLIGSQSDPEVWRKTVEPTQTLYSWALNNHWGTNYRQYQEGEIRFRYALRPHQKYEPAETYRLATAMTQPLLLSGNSIPGLQPDFKFEGSDLVVISVKPADEGDGIIIRLYNPDTEKHSGKIISTSSNIWLSNTAEEKFNKLDPKISLDGMQLITVRIE